MKEMKKDTTIHQQNVLVVLRVCINLIGLLSFAHEWETMGFEYLSNSYFKINSKCFK